MGVEEEFLVFDRAAPRLLDIGPQVVAAAERNGADDAQFEKELKRAQAELASSPTERLDALEHDLGDRRAELCAAAARQQARLVASGTCPVPGTTETTDEARYKQMARRFAEVERQQLVCAMHVHVDIASDDEGVAAINGMAGWLPGPTRVERQLPLCGRDRHRLRQLPAHRLGPLAVCRVIRTWPTQPTTTGSCSSSSRPARPGTAE